MNILLWIIQALVGAMFLMAGFMKLTKTKDELREKVGEWVDAFPDLTIKLIGLLEVAAAIGLVLPMALLILPILTPLAALGLVFTMIGATIVHIKRKEYSKLKINVVLLLLTLFIFIGRFLIIPVNLV